MRDRSRKQVWSGKAQSSLCYHSDKFDNLLILPKKTGHSKVLPRRHSRFSPTHAQDHNSLAGKKQTFVPIEPCKSPYVRLRY